MEVDLRSVAERGAMNGEDTHIGEVDNYAGAEDINSDGSVLKLTLKIGDEYGCPNLPKTGDEVATTSRTTRASTSTTRWATRTRRRASRPSRT